MRRLLGTADAALVPFLAIGGFAGLRSAEIELLDWSKVDLEAGFIRVDASIAKTNSRRLVPLLPNLRVWLEPYAKANGPVVGLANVANAIQRLVATMKEGMPEFEWKHNALRHSFISYRVAQIQNLAQVALEAGNSPQMIFKHYRELVRPAEAEKWFAETPAIGKEEQVDRQAAAEGNIIALTGLQMSV